MMSNVELVWKLSKELDVHGVELEKKWVICRYGGFNNVPDFNSTTNEFKPEYKECPNRGKCTLSGCVCTIPANLTHQELNAVKAIVTGEPAKIAAGRMGIKFNTIRAYLKSVHVKLNAHSRADVVNFAHNNGMA
jgi:DNA-binding NarL/FixJ family response regulator